MGKEKAPGLPPGLYRFVRQEGLGEQPPDASVLCRSGEEPVITSA
jgi:hypothetical protein